MVGATTACGCLLGGRQALEGGSHPIMFVLFEYDFSRFVQCASPHVSLALSTQPKAMWQPFEFCPNMVLT